MKKSLLVSLILLSGVLLTACWKKSEEVVDNVQPTDTTEIVDCKTAVEKYLKWADQKWEWEEIKEWDNIVVDYIWRLEDGTVFDTSIKSIAEACWVYNEARDYTEWLSFQAWAGQMIKWFDDAVIWMRIWQTKTVQFGPEEWYGEYNDEYVVTYTKDEIGDLSTYNVWDPFQPNPYAIGVITKITDKEMVVDFNSELAWKNLIFDITVKNIYWEADNQETVVAENEETVNE